jgi:D-sedoheptulose 7-phosphate isomerase
MIEEMAAALDSLDKGAIEAVANDILRAYGTKNRIFIFGNGGSASISSHFAGDLTKYTMPRKNFHVISLSDNIPLITAISNDISYDEVFREQLRLHSVRNGDVAVAISSKGNSRNVINAVRFANETGAFTIGFTGASGGALKDAAQRCIIVKSEKYTIIEPVHSFICHMIAERLKAAFQNPEV